MGNKLSEDYRKPLEIRLSIRIMLYLSERKLSPDLGKIIGLAAGFQRVSLSLPDGDGIKSFKISIDEFQDLCKEANVSSLDVEKQVDILTELWIKKTGYWRNGLS